MRPFVSKMTQFLQQHCTFIGHASMSGHMYDLGLYPGAVYETETEEKVLGQVFQLHDAARVFQMLDAYEGIEPQNLQHNEYRRAQVTVQMKDDSKLCWTYLYNFTTDGLFKIPEGDYLAYAKDNLRHQNFIRSV